MSGMQRTSVLNNMCSIMATMAEFSSHHQKTVAKTAGDLHYVSGISFPLFNGIFCQQSFEEQKLNHSYLSQVMDFFKEKQVPYCWWWLNQTELPTSLIEQLNNNDFVTPGDFDGVSVALSDVEFANLNVDEDIKIVEATEADAFADFMSILQQVFEFSDDVNSDLSNVLTAIGAGKGFAHYLAYYQDTPAAILTAYTKDNSVGLYNGATLTEFRNKGLCSGLAKRALSDAIKQGSELAVGQLMPSSFAAGLLEKIGFKKCCTMVPYIKFA